MNTLEYCRTRRKEELAAFVRVLKALPEDRLDYRPDPRSRTARELAWLLVEEEASLVDLLDKGKVEWVETKPTGTAAEMLAAFEKNAAAVNERLAKLDEAGWEKKGAFVFGGGPPWEQPVRDFVFLWLFDAVHHRGQLSAYLRPMGAKVPSIYGPSADDTGQ